MREFNSPMYVSYRRAVSPFARGVPTGLGRQIRARRPVFRRSTLHFTSMPATKRYATPVFTSPNRPRNLKIERISRIDLGEIWEPPGASREAPKRPQRGPKEAFLGNQSI